MFEYTQGHVLEYMQAHTLALLFDSSGFAEKHKSRMHNLDISEVPECTYILIAPV